MKILMVAAENDAIKGAKVGGVADVVRDVPTALAMLGHNVDVIIPDYGNYTQVYESTKIASFFVPFSGHHEEVTLHELFIGKGETKVKQYILSHALFCSGGIGRVYLDDPSDRPFSSDATKYALFCAAVVQALHEQHLPKPDVLHLHDWHSALVAVLCEYSTKYNSLNKIHKVYTVHNLALQGIRPFNHDESSLEHWFGSLSYDGQVICDPRYPHCFNPMRAAINLADKVHLVSPTYALEVVEQSNFNKGFFGGEGLEQDLKKASLDGRVVGILNGCDYQNLPNTRVSSEQFLKYAKKAILSWMSLDAQLKTVHYLASERINQWVSIGQLTGPLVTSIGRLTDQKVLLLRQNIGHKDTFSELLNHLDTKNGRMIILGSGDKQIELEFTKLMAHHDNFLFLNGYGHELSEDLYLLGDLFLMPSSFEPCGISQMLALRAGQPCLVHSVGGLKDTIKHLDNGFCFNGESIIEQQENLISTFKQSLDIFMSKPSQWQNIVNKAKQTRFNWQDSAKSYIADLY
jgi:starch synthase